MKSIFSNPFSVSKLVQHSTHFKPLSPTNKATKAEDYLSAIFWAIENKKTIKNIAITGPYGSGKSSIIQTFQENHKKNKSFNFLNISLATFKEDPDLEKKSDKSELASIKKKDNDEILRLIELSILQQIFYHETDSKVPDSRFSKIEKRNKFLLGLNSIFLFLIIIICIYLFKTDLWAKISLFELDKESEKIVKSGAVILLFVSIFFGGQRLVHLLRSIALKKVVLSNTEIEVDEKVSKSILNRYLDEIIYFFEVTKYNIVVIEDLDRFEQTGVFTKLREINFLLNNSKKIKNEIVFVYAIRDEMFKDKDRAKFFDFIIPVIPVINSSNSSEKLLEIVRTNKYKISDALIDDVSLFIDDMRLLYNVMNEYYIYSKKIDSNLVQDKLLSIIIYKNLYPKDFSSLSQNEGVLYKTFANKHSYIKTAIENLNKQLKEARASLKLAEEQKFQNKMELRRVYIQKIVEKVNDIGHGFYGLNVANHLYRGSRLIEDDIFEALKNNPNNIEFYYTNSNRTHLSMNFKKIEEEVDSKLNYTDRASYFSESPSSSVEHFQTKILELEREISSVKKQKLRDLLIFNQIVVGDKDDELKQKEMLNVLLRQGYIDEDYNDYLSIFYEGSLSRVDYDFLIALKTQRETPYDLKLIKIENLLKKISIFEFEKKRIFNFDLISYLLSSDNVEQRDKFINQLADGSSESLAFIKAYLEVTPKIELFIKFLTKSWKSFWLTMDRSPEYPQDKKDGLLKLILTYADVEDIRINFQGSEEVIAGSNYLFLIDDLERVKDIISSLSLKIKMISNSSSQDLVNYIFDHNYYEINIHNLRTIVFSKTTITESQFATSNYKTLLNSGLPKLIEYIDANFEYYLEEVFLKLEMNNMDTEEFIVKILNREEILDDLKSLVLGKVNLRISNVDLIEDLTILNLALNMNKIVPHWEQIIKIYELNDKEFIGELVNYLNDLSNSKLLSKEDIKSDDTDSTEDFSQSLILENQLTIDSYSLLIPCIPYSFTDLNLKHLDLDKMKILIEANILDRNVSNFKMLKESFPSIKLNILNKTKVDDNTEIISVMDAEDVKDYLESSKFSFSDKEKILNIKPLDVLDESDLINVIANILSKKKLDVADEKIRLVLTKNDLEVEEKIKLFIEYQHKFSNDNITDFLATLPEPYSTLTEKGRFPKLDNSKDNMKLVELLKDKKYVSSFKVTLFGKIQVSNFKA